MQRIRLVMRPSILNQPVPVVAEMVNAWLAERGLAPVTERTIRNDIDRALLLHRERIVGGVDWYRAQFQALLADVWMSIDATARGKERAALYADAIRVLEDMARIDGVWTRPPDEVGQETVFEGEVTNVQELVETGEITHDQLSAYLLVLHRETGGIGAPSRAAGAPLPAGDLETRAEDAGPLPLLPRRRRSAPQLPRASGREDRTPGGPARGLGPMGDELPGDVVDWVPDEE
jgi:hypothetical protein